MLLVATLNSAAKDDPRRHTETHISQLNLHTISGLLLGPSLCNHLIPKLADNEWLRFLNLIHKHLRDGAAKVDAGHVADERARAARRRKHKRHGT
jgi:hypothetical protein